MSLPDADSFYLPLQPGHYQPSVHAQGAWSEREQHMAPVSGLIMHEVTRHDPRPEMQVARVSFDILGMIHAVPTHVEVRTVRPGRTIELIEAVLRTADRDTVRARVWRLATHDTSAVAAVEDAPMPGPATAVATDRMARWPGGYIASIEAHDVLDGAAGPPRPGRSRTWLRTDIGLVEGVDSDPVARYLGLVDTANGVGPRQDPREWIYPNVDLSVHFHRVPTGGWVGLDTSVSWGATGLGITSTVLHDETGPVGRAEQVLTIRRNA